MISDVYIKRAKGDDQGTIGVLVVPLHSFRCFTNELPDRDNEHNYSRIPTGTYIAKLVHTEHYGDVYLLENVEDRSSVLMHCGNFAGDTKKNWKSDVRGCIEFGIKVVIISGQRAVINTRSARDAFQKTMNGQNFILTIS